MNLISNDNIMDNKDINNFHLKFKMAIHFLLIRFKHLHHNVGRGTQCSFKLLNLSSRNQSKIYEESKLKFLEFG